MCKRNRDGSKGTQATRKGMLVMIGNQLYEMGYTKLRAHGIKGRHVEALIERWTREGISTATVKNRMVVLRWWCEKVERKHVMYPDNRSYGIPDRKFKNENRAYELTDEALARIDGPYAERMRLSLLLMRFFGMRRAEGIKFAPSYAIRRDGDQITSLHMKASWCKGGRARVIPVVTDHQREILEACERLVGSGSMIPPELTYKEYLSKFEYRTRAAGIDRKHSFRHAYAQRLYEDVSGLPSPHNGGVRPETEEEKERDHAARMEVSLQLGHNRLDVSTSYVGRVPRE